MGIIWMPGGGGGADLDVITAGAADVLEGKVIVDQDGNPIGGTMPNRGAWESSGLAAGSSVVIPPGYHNGAGKVTAKDLASQTPGNLAANKMLAGTYGYSNGARVDGNIVSQGALTLNPGTTAKTGSVAGKYMTGNITVPAVSIPAAYIKKNQVITFPDGSKVTGTFEGWVATPTDLYYNGVDPAGFSTGGGSSGITYDGIRITIPQNRYSPYITASNSYNFTPYTKLNIDMQYSKDSLNTGNDTGISISNVGGSSIDASIKTGDRYAGRYTFSIDITNIGITVRPRLVFNAVAWYGDIYIYHIWLS